MDALIYCRVSTERQAREGLSLAAQESECRKVAEAAGDTVVEVIRDPGYSGGSLDRPGMQRLLGILEGGGAWAVYVWDISRFARNLKDQVTILSEMRERGQRIVSLQQNFDYATSTGALAINVLAAAAQMQREETAEKVRMVLEDKLERGEPVSKAPYGYRYEEKAWVPDVQQAAIVREVFRRYAQGDSAHAIMRWLVAEDAPTAQGGRWHLSHVTQMLTNVAYVGRLAWGDMEAAGNHEALVSREVWDRVQARRARRAQIHPRRKDASIADLFVCAECGSGIIITNTRQYRYYRCHDQRDMPQEVHRDAPLHLSERATNDILALHTRRLIMRGYTQAGADAIAEHAASAGNAERAREVAEELAQVEEKIARNLEAYHAEAIPAELLREQNAPLMVRREELREVLDREAQAAGAPAPSDVRRITEATLDMVLREDRIDRLRELYALLYRPIELGADRTLTIRARWPVEPIVYHVPRGYSPDVRGDELDLDELRLR